MLRKALGLLAFSWSMFIVTLPAPVYAGGWDADGSCKNKQDWFNKKQNCQNQGWNSSGGQKDWSQCAQNDGAQKSPWTNAGDKPACPWNKQANWSQKCNKGDGQGQAQGWGSAPGSYPMKDGGKLVVDPDGTKHFNGADGSEKIMRPDGTGLWRRADGSQIEKFADGRKVFRSADGQEKTLEAGRCQ
ncbi:MAG: hypothetical protein K2X77_31170 [Candidatus Obscuribacterales bacterium]|jgi:hypothetical protein|nr:hypothetical protein [Candidatus Obscuribacterales bacterium]